MTDSRERSEDPTTDTSLRDLHFVGPVTARLLKEGDISVADIQQKNVSYRQLVELGINRGVAAKIRREHSLPWTITGMGSDLSRRSRTVNGLSEAERQWVAQSDADWESDEVTASHRPARPELAKDVLGFELIDEPPELTDVGVLDGVDEDDAAALAEAGINTVRRLATVDPSEVADALDRDGDIVKDWHQKARNWDA